MADAGDPPWLVKMRRDRARREARTVPMPRLRKGRCRWCAEPLSGRRTSWHAECLEQFYLHTEQRVQRAHLEARDGRCCALCGADPIRCLKGDPTAQLVINEDGTTGYIHYHRVSFPSALQVDHEVPIWALSVLPRRDRVAFFGPSNLRLLCPACHKAKTKREAAVRSAHRKRNKGA